MKARTPLPLFRLTNRRFLNIAALMFIMLGLAMPLLPVAHAAAPVLTNLASKVCSGAAITTTCQTSTFTMSTQTTLIMFFENVANSSMATPATVASVTDSQPLTWTKLGSEFVTGGASGCTPVCIGPGDMEIWYAQTVGHSGGAQTVTATLSSPTGGMKYQPGYVDVFQISPAELPASFQGAFNTGGIAPTGLTMTAPAVNYPANTLLIGIPQINWCINSGCSAQTTGTSIPTLAIGANTFTSLVSSTACANANANGACRQWGIQYYFDATSEAPTFSPQVVDANTNTIDNSLFVMTYWNPSGSIISGGTAQTLNVGNCPTKNTATTTLVNNTEYFYTVQGLSPWTMGPINTFIAQVTSAATPQTLSIGVYATTGVGAVSAGNTLFLIAAFSKSLSAGTTNNLLSWNPAVSSSGTIVGVIPTGATIAIAILGTNKIKINQSSLAGMFTGATSGNALAATYTSLTGSATQLYLCTTLSYQSVSTTTSISTSTVTTSTTTTSTVAGQVNPTVIANSNFMLAIIVILGPSLILAAATKSLWGGILGALLGGAAGAFIGFLPFWVPVVIVVGCITVLFFARGGGGDKM